MRCKGEVDMRAVKVRCTGEAIQVSCTAQGLVMVNSCLYSCVKTLLPLLDL